MNLFGDTIKKEKYNKDSASWASQEKVEGGNEEYDPKGTLKKSREEKP